MTPTARAYVDRVVDDEGFHYTFMRLSEFTDVDDTEFHRLRKEYIRAADALKEYITEEDSDDE